MMAPAKEASATIQGAMRASRPLGLMTAMMSAASSEKFPMAARLRMTICVAEALLIAPLRLTFTRLKITAKIAMSARTCGSQMNFGAYFVVDAEENYRLMPREIEGREISRLRLPILIR